MIIIRYLVRETLKSQLAILFILLLIFSVRSWSGSSARRLMAKSQRIWCFPARAWRAGNGAAYPAVKPVPWSADDPGKLYTESEITVMHACGLSKAVLVKAAMVLALFTGIVAAVNVMWAGPTSSRHQDEVLAEAKANPGLAALAQGSSSRRPTVTPCCLSKASMATASMTCFLLNCARKVTLGLLWWWRTPVSCLSVKTALRLSR